jgi:hypothetical protein
VEYPPEHQNGAFKKGKINKDKRGTSNAKR